MHDMVRVIFRRLEDLDPVAEEKAANEDGLGTAVTVTELRMNVSPTSEAPILSLDQMVESEYLEEKTPIQAVADGKVAQ
jgi:hypothetical protein